VDPDSFVLPLLQSNNGTVVISQKTKKKWLSQLKWFGWIFSFNYFPTPGHLWASFEGSREQIGANMNIL